MPIAFPNNDLFAADDIVTNSFYLQFLQSMSRTRSRSLVVADFSLPIWQASYVTARMSHDDCVAFEARLNALEGAVATFLARDTRRAMPRAYQFGGFVDGGVVDSLGVDGKSLTLSGLPAGFRISLGDYFSIIVGGVSLLYQASEGVTCDGAGLSPLFAIQPHYDLSLLVGQAVVFQNPSCVMRIEPGSVQFNDTGSVLGTVAFGASQI